jgi:hypothetical protein
VNVTRIAQALIDFLVGWRGGGVERNSPSVGGETNRMKLFCSYRPEGRCTLGPRGTRSGVQAMENERTPEQLRHQFVARTTGGNVIAWLPHGFVPSCRRHKGPDCGAGPLRFQEPQD